MATTHTPVWMEVTRMRRMLQQNMGRLGLSLACSPQLRSRHLMHKSMLLLIMMVKLLLVLLLLLLLLLWNRTCHARWDATIRMAGRRGCKSTRPT